MTINEAITAIEELLASMSAVVSSQVRPSGDDVDVIKVWVDLGQAKLDPNAWARTLEREIAKQIPGTTPYRIQVRAEVGA